MTQAQPITTDAPYDELRASTTGTVAVAGDADYAALVTPWNLAIEVRPDAVLAARTAQDVVAAVRFAGEHGLVVTPQATGHGAISAFVGQLLVNTAGLDECVVHPEGWARVGAGVKWLRVVEAAAPYGLAPLSGSITDVGIVGYITGGGLGPMARTYGLAADRVRAIEVVTGDGELRRATPTEHPDLFFGLRGGKGALGIVTAIEFDLVEQPRFYGGALWFDGDHAATVIERWRAWSAELPEAATTSFALFQLPEMPGVPPQLAGRLTLSVRYVWTGDAAEGASRLAPMRDAAPLLIDDVADKPYTAIDSVHTDPLDPVPGSEAAAVLTDFPAAAADALLARGRSGIGIAADPGGGPADGRRHRPRRRVRQRVLLPGRRVRAVRRWHRDGARRSGTRPVGAGRPRAVDRRAPDAELHLRRRGPAVRLRRLDPRPVAARHPHLRPAGRHRHRPCAQLVTRPEALLKGCCWGRSPARGMLRAPTSG